MTAMVGAVLGLIGSGMDAYGQYQSGQQEKRQQEYNARIAEQSAQATRQGAAFNELVTRRGVHKQIGAQRAAFAKSGVNFTGSAIDVMVDSLTNAEMAIAADNWNAEVQARGYESEANMRRWYGKMAAAKANTQASRTLLQSSVDFGSKMGVFGK